MRLRASWMTATVVSCQWPLRWRVPRLTSPLSSVPSSALTRSRCASMPPFKAVQFTANVCLLHDRPVYAFRMAEVRQQSTSAQSAVESVASRPRRGTSSALLKRSAEPGGVDPTGKALERHHCRNTRSARHSQGASCTIGLSIARAEKLISLACPSRSSSCPGWPTKFYFRDQQSSDAKRAARPRLHATPAHLSYGNCNRPTSGMADGE